MCVCVCVVLLRLFFIFRFGTARDGGYECKTVEDVMGMYVLLQGRFSFAFFGFWVWLALACMYYVMGCGRGVRRDLLFLFFF